MLITQLVVASVWLKEGGSAMIAVIQTVGFIARDAGVPACTVIYSQE